MKDALRRHLETYESFHRHPMNKLCHYVGIPLIVFHVIAMLDWVLLGHLGGREITLAYPLFALVIGWYFTLDAKLAPLMAVWYGLCIPLGWYAPWSVIYGAAAVGWTIQLLGHLVWEKRSPAFLANLLQALIGPLYFAAKATGRWPIRAKAPPA